MAEWSNAAVLKTVGPARVPGVRIPLSPPRSQPAIAHSNTNAQSYSIELVLSDHPDWSAWCALLRQFVKPLQV